MTSIRMFLVGGLTIAQVLGGRAFAQQLPPRDKVSQTVKTAPGVTLGAPLTLSCKGSSSARFGYYAPAKGAYNSGRSPVWYINFTWARSAASLNNGECAWADNSPSGTGTARVCRTPTEYVQDEYSLAPLPGSSTLRPVNVGYTVIVPGQLQFATNGATVTFRVTAMSYDQQFALDDCLRLL